MDIQPIRTEADYKAALRQLSTLMESDPEPGTPGGDRLDILAVKVPSRSGAAIRFANWEQWDRCHLP